MPRTPDYYGVLGVAKTASNEDIRRAYSRSAHELHKHVRDWDP